MTKSADVNTVHWFGMYSSRETRKAWTLLVLIHFENLHPDPDGDSDPTSPCAVSKRLCAIRHAFFALRAAQVL